MIPSRENEILNDVSRAQKRAIRLYNLVTQPIEHTFDFDYCEENTVSDSTLFKTKAVALVLKKDLCRLFSEVRTLLCNVGWGSLVTDPPPPVEESKKYIDLASECTELRKQVNLLSKALREHGAKEEV